MLNFISLITPRCEADINASNSSISGPGPTSACIRSISLARVQPRACFNRRNAVCNDLDSPVLSKPAPCKPDTVCAEDLHLRLIAGQRVGHHVLFDHAVGGLRTQHACRFCKTDARVRLKGLTSAQSSTITCPARPTLLPRITFAADPAVVRYACISHEQIVVTDFSDISPPPSVPRWIVTNSRILSSVADPCERPFALCTSYPATQILDGRVREKILSSPADCRTFPGKAFAMSLVRAPICTSAPMMQLGLRYRPWHRHRQPDSTMAVGWIGDLFGRGGFGLVLQFAHHLCFGYQPDHPPSPPRPFWRPSLYAESAPFRGAADRRGLPGAGTLRRLSKPAGTNLLSRSGILLSTRIPGRLRHRFDDQDTGHHGKFREVSVEKWFVDGDVLDADDPFRFELDDLIHQQKWVPMRQYPPNLVNVQNGHGKGTVYPPLPYYWRLAAAASQLTPLILKLERHGIYETGIDWG